ncbi:hypothetical protein P153DRAFT_342691 [Dothidotthia symphoricarpi CBS 119687]|uniref:Uncharacterized protein n=1 Tax=Dothidotthia symphoricarpi CBS 119687 TaxID=1392245 RepID=A0A6A6AA30_9PLEO|nr:uncharacterized protein P153DRAFT_342691 [Dothidotthia symphoricarpi CBS 119687]KAF2128680.1 hypothetical protein P153DRAFT_342691 [Dothidotthia symphoricarpi CBS 119687]
MPLCTLYLLALHPTTSLPTFLKTLASSSLTPLVISRVIRWIILPSHLSTTSLLAQNIHWDILLVLPGTADLPPNLTALIAHSWRIAAGVPSALVADFAAKNETLLKPKGGSVPPLRKSAGIEKRAPSSQALELSAELESWIAAFVKRGGPEANGTVSMFNLLAFKPGLKDSYLEYGRAFASEVGSGHGGVAKVVGKAVAGSEGMDGSARAEGDVGGWDEIALAHYPSIRHFGDMLTDKAYQEVNQRCRVPSLRDTAILMTSEVGILGLGEGKGKMGVARL